jgi:thiosulfate dehydrogenase (quinone) large subunit
MRFYASRSGSTYVHGVVRWVAGLGSFAQSLVPMFQKTPSPSWSVYGFALALPILEAVVGAVVAAGYRTRTALAAGASLMLV